MSARNRTMYKNRRIERICENVELSFKIDSQKEKEKKKSRVLNVNKFIPEFGFKIV